ncbi:peptidoglycan recognition protein [Cellulomonas algicola]
MAAAGLVAGAGPAQALPVAAGGTSPAAQATLRTDGGSAAAVRAVTDVPLHEVDLTVAPPSGLSAFALPAPSTTGPTLDETDPDTTASDATTPDAATADRPHGSDRVRTEPIATSEHTTLGVSWADPAASLAVQVRTRTDGTWSQWRALDDEVTSPDASTSEAQRTLRGGTEAVWIGDADAVELSFPATTAVPADLELTLVGDAATDGVTGDVTDGAGTAAGTATTDGTGARTAAATTTAALEDGDVGALAQASSVAAPAIVSRAEWGAAPQLCAFDVASTLQFAVVHHTAGSNAYTSVAQAMAQIRNDQRYHQQSRGWCDIGYNYLVDKWGNVYEGRAGSGDRPVIGVHAGGFNTGSVGVSMLGEYGAVAPPAATQESVARLIAWRLASYHRDPAGSFWYTTGGGENSRYAAGTRLQLPVVIGHRDVAFTACPGERGYAMLGAVRSRARDLVGSQMVNPYLLSTSLAYGAGTAVASDVVGSIGWTLTVVDRRTGVELVRRAGSTGPTSGTTIAGWDGRSDAGVALGAGPYTLTMTGTDLVDGSPLVPWSQNFEITGSQNPPVVAAVPLTGSLRYEAVDPARLVDTRATGGSLGASSRMDLKVAGVAGVPADAKAVALNITAVSSAGVSYVSAWPAGQARPGASVLNADAGRTTAASTVVGVGGQGLVSLYNNAGSVHLVVDVTGYFTDSGATDGYAPLTTAARALDTRTSGGAIPAGGRRTVPLAGTSGIPADATAVVVNVVSRAAGYGNVAVVPSGSAPGITSTVNHVPGRDVANRAVVPLRSGAVDVNVAGSAADVVVDVVGWFGPGGTQRFTPVAPARAFDTRLTGRQLGDGQTRTFPVASVGGVPADASSVVLNLTATRANAYATYLTAWGPGSRPATSDLNAGAGADIANVTFVRPGTSGVSVYNNAGSVDVVGDVMGYFR